MAKKAVVITTSILVIGGIGGYLLWDHFRKPEGSGSGDQNDQDSGNEESEGSKGGSKGGSSGGSSVQIKDTGYKPQTKTELATNYRLWANSTQALSKKYGAESSYDLDKTGSANSYFEKSYAAGKTEYEAYLKTLEKIKYADLPNNLKGIAKALGFENTTKDYFKQNSAGNFYIAYNNNKGNRITIFDTGTYRVTPKNDTGKKLSEGSVTGNLSSITPFSNYPKAGTAISYPNNVHHVFVLATTSPEQDMIASNPKMSNSSAQNIANELFDAVNGGGTKDTKFWNNMYKAKNMAQWKQVYEAFGSREGWNLDRWINNDMENPSERAKVNKWAGEPWRNVRLRLTSGYKNWPSGVSKRSYSGDGSKLIDWTHAT